MGPGRRSDAAVTSRDPLGSLTGHVFVPLALFVVLALLLEFTRLDAWLADLLFRWEGGAWTLRRDPLVRDLLHDDAKRIVGGVYVLLVIASGAAFFVPRLQRYRRGLVYLLVTVAGSTLLIAMAKDVTRVNCPWSIADYGGDQPYLTSLRAVLAHGPSGRCFPSGHAGSAFAFVSGYFLCRAYAPRWRWPALCAALLIGATFGIAQQLRGAHFLSHDLWALAICWFVACAATPILRRVPLAASGVRPNDRVGPSE